MWIPSHLFQWKIHERTAVFHRFRTVIPRMKVQTPIVAKVKLHHTVYGDYSQLVKSEKEGGPASAQDKVENYEAESLHGYLEKISFMDEYLINQDALAAFSSLLDRHFRPRPRPHGLLGRCPCAQLHTCTCLHVYPLC